MARGSTVYNQAVLQVHLCTKATSICRGDTRLDWLIVFLIAKSTLYAVPIFLVFCSRKVPNNFWTQTHIFGAISSDRSLLRTTLQGLQCAIHIVRRLGSFTLEDYKRFWLPEQAIHQRNTETECSLAKYTCCRLNVVHIHSYLLAMV